MISVYKKKIDNGVTIRDYDAMKKYIKLIQWGRKNPVQFIELVLGIKLMDYQKWMVAMSWVAEYACFTCSRNIGKSFIVGCIAMARNILFPKYQTRIVSENWTTANDTFKKMEDIATNQIKTIVNTNTVFIDELLKTKSDSDGFTHDAKNGSQCSLINGSEITAVAGRSKSARGKRANMLIADEAGFISRELFDDIFDPYLAQDSKFKLGTTFDPEVYPQDVPNIRLYVGSASDTDSYFYSMYKLCTKRMLMGDKRYFAADLSCEIPMHPTVDGKPVPPLLSQEEVDRKMRQNEIAANREYYNIFDHFNLEDAVVTRSDIISNTEYFIPYIRSNSSALKYIIAFDPAAKLDNSPVLVMEVTKQGKEIIGRTVYMENLVVTYGDGSKRPMRVDEQVERLRFLINAFNGKDSPAYEKVTLVLDGGSGGQASAITQELAKDWKDNFGNLKRGVYDEDNEYSVRWAEPYKHCVSGCLKIIEPRKFRNAMFEAAKVLVPQGFIKFSPPCPKYDVLVTEDGSEKKITKTEMAALIQLDLMKEEIISMVRTKTPTGGITYQLPPEKRGKIKDDRNYTFVLACWELKNMREDEEFGDGKALDYSNMFTKDKEEKRETREDAPWMQSFGHVTTPIERKRSPFQGKSPFMKK